MRKVVFLVLFHISAVLYSQKIEVSGRVLDEVTKVPLSGVNIFSNNKLKGTSTNFNGEFKIQTQLKNTLIFSLIGYKSVKKVIIKSKLRVFLREYSTELEQVVVRGKTNINDIYPRRATGAVGSVPIDKIKQRPATNILEYLQGQLAGVFVKSDGELGKSLTIRIRGTSTIPIKTRTENLNEQYKKAYDDRANQPLFVLDGQIISAEGFATININDVQEIKVLKDAVANALYGIKAANGVIEITSKRGINGKTQYTFSFQQGITLKGQPSVKMMNTSEKLEFERLTQNENTPGYRFSQDYYKTYQKDNPNLNQLIAKGQQKLDSLRQINTDWFKKLTRISTYQSYNFSLRGGNKNNKFYISANFTKQGGKFDGNNIDRFTAKLNYDLNLSKKVALAFNSSFGTSQSNTPNSSNYTPSQLIYELNPYEQMQKGELISYPKRTFADLVNQYSKKNNNNRFNFSVNLFSKLYKNLNLTSIIGVDYLFENSLAITPRNSYSEISGNFPKKERGKAVKDKNVSINFSTNTRLNFEKRFGNHMISASANVDFYKNQRDFIGISGYGLPSKLNSGAGINNDLRGTRRSRTSSSKTNDAQLGFGLSCLYNWNDKIELYGSFKNDGSSSMPKDKRWNTFWATGLSYTISNENFLKDNPYISYLKFRATYGVTASLASIDASMAVPTFSYGTNGYLGIREFYLKNLFNLNLRPEKSTSINLGMDIGIADICNITVDAYSRRTDHMLLTVPIEPSSGFPQQLKNVGVMLNRGLEFSINATLLDTEKFTWSSSANLSYNQNKVVELYQGTELNVSGQPYPDYKEGSPVDLIYGLVSLGVYPADGIFRYRGYDGREIHGSLGKVTSKDFVVLGYSTPPFSGGCYQSISYKNWQLSFDFYYNFGGKARYSNKSVVLDSRDANKNAVSGQLEDTWFEPGDEGKKYQSLDGNWNESALNHSYPTDRTVGKTDFIRLNNIMLRYRFNDDFLNKISKSYITSWQMYAQMKNIATWSNFGGGDPESANLIGSSQPIITMGTTISF